MEIAEHIAHLGEEGERFAEAATAAGLDSPVPTCPGWQVRDLVQHLSGVHRWATAYLVTGNLGATTEAEDAELFAAAEDGVLIPRFRRGHAALVAALTGAPPELACWTFLAAPSPLAFWARRQAHETTIHRVDAEAAVGRQSGCSPQLAGDGIDELLRGFLSRPRGRLVADPPVALAVRASDTGQSWTIRIEPERRLVSSGAAGADCTVTGAASDLYLLLWNRRAAGGTVDVEGDTAVLDLWRERATIRWS
ncbi:MAG: maleylpyruvate isomerase family mycothiol-dependent enzyme [Candidatus Dormibacteria bacterium]